LKKNAKLNLGITLVLFTALAFPLCASALVTTYRYYCQARMRRGLFFIKKGWIKAKLEYETIGDTIMDYDGSCEYGVYDSDYAWREVDYSAGPGGIPEGIGCTAHGEFYEKSWDSGDYYYVTACIMGYGNGQDRSSVTKTKFGDPDGIWTVGKTSGTW
jgi:hypothetical protein